MIKIKKTSGPNIVKSLRKFNEKAQPVAEARALNLVARKAKTMAIRTVAKRLNMPQKLVRYRLNMAGAKKGDRIKKIRAAYASQNVRQHIFTVYMRGIPVHQIAGKRPARQRGFVKAKGGRKYEGAFYGQSKNGVMVFKPRSNPGSFKGTSRGGRLMVPKVGVRQALRGQLDERTRGRTGKAIFKKEFSRQIRIAANRIR